MTNNLKDSLFIKEVIVSQTLTVKVNGHNVTLTFSPNRNDVVSNQIKKILLDSYIHKKL